MHTRTQTLAMLISLGIAHFSQAVKTSEVHSEVLQGELDFYTTIAFELLQKSFFLLTVNAGGAMISLAGGVLC